MSMMIRCGNLIQNPDEDDQTKFFFSFSEKQLDNASRLKYKSKVNGVDLLTLNQIGLVVFRPLSRVDVNIRWR